MKTKRKEAQLNCNWLGKYTESSYRKLTTKPKGRPAKPSPGTKAQSKLASVFGCTTRLNGAAVYYNMTTYFANFYTHFS